MGSDSAAVLDPRLSVRGLHGLRVVDASVMPRLLSANTNAAAIMIGERGSDFLLADARKMAA
jgi:choline dehydrogenase